MELSIIALLFAAIPLYFGKFEKAVAISIDNTGNVFVIDQGKNQFTKFSSDGDSIFSVGSQGWKDSEFDKPTDICAKNGLDIFISDYNNHRIQRYNRKMNFIGTLFTRDDESSLARFRFPLSVMMNSKGELLVVEGENKRVVKFSKFEKAEQSVGGFDAGKGKLKMPIQIDIDSSDRVFVLERTRIVVFDSFGNFLQIIGDGKFHNANGFCIVGDDILVANGNAMLLFSLSGEFLGTRNNREILFSDKDFEIIDFAVWKNRLYVLTEDRVYIVNQE